VIAGPLDTGTWRWAYPCATWLYELASDPGQPSPAVMAECARRMLGALPGFAVPAAAEWTTEAGGEDAVVHGRGTPIDEATLATTFRDHPDVIHLAFDLDLLVLAPDGATEMVLEGGARLHLEREEGKLALWLDLHVDLYARLTMGEHRDNERLARLNAPRLAGFLARLTASTGARFHSVDASSYAGQSSERGFDVT
jgi:hypothetical protein